MTNTSDEVGHTATPYFWCGDFLMADRSKEYHSEHVMFVNKDATLNISEADKAFILSACNSHNSLVKALEEIVKAADNEDAADPLDFIFETARTALSQAKGGK